MAINTSLLIAAPILQDYFSDNATDAAMSAGVITCFKDNSRTTLKDWYYQTGQPGSYTYTKLPNPLTLSAAGTITDAMGNDTIPFWYPYATDNQTLEPYYVTVDNSNGQRQFTRQNFPFVADTGNALTSTLQNLIVNNVFYRNVGSVSLTTTQQAILAPSQHEGYLSVASGTQPAMSDIQFFKNANGAVDTITFMPFSSELGSNDPTPEFYLNFQCTNSGSGETTKYIQIPVCLHTLNLSDYDTASLSIWTQNTSGSANNTINVKLLQFYGTGTTSPPAASIVSITTTPSWTRTIVRFPFPSSTVPATSPGDDGWFLQISYPVGKAFNINIAKPSVYLSNVVPTNDFATYEMVSGTINTPRTGDIKQTISDYTPFGWVPLNNGTIGNASSAATGRGNIDTWPLFNLIWQKFHAFTSGSTNVLAQMVTSAGSNVAYGASAIADWTANNSIALTQTMGKVLLGTVPINSLTNVFKNTFVAVNGGGNLQLNMAVNVTYFSGMPIYFTNSGGALPTGLSANTIYYVSNFNGASVFFVATSFANALLGTVIAYTDSGSGTHTAIPELSGTFEGEYFHTLFSEELPNPITSTAATVTVTPGGGSTAIQSSVSTATGHISNSNGGQGHNNTQPGVFVNMLMKL